MTAKAGETARKTGEITCTGCEGRVRVTAGQKILKCPCGGETFQEPQKKETSKSGATRK